MDIERQALYEAYERCCENCMKKYFEECCGIGIWFGRVDGCDKVIEKYTERFNKLSCLKNKY